jgi:hypothetical protein
VDNDHPYDEGTIQALLLDYVNHRQPRLLSIHKSLDSGQRLNDFDLEFLEDSISRWDTLRPLIERHPEYKPLVVKNIKLISEISEHALNNERHPHKL